MNKIAASVFLAGFLFLAGCAGESPSESKENEMQSSVQWADVLYWNGTKYHYDEEKTEIISRKDTDQELGEITFSVMFSEEEDNPDYLLQENEATILKEGSKFYSIVGEDSSEYLYAEEKVYRGDG
ncbi:hypothetical protein [Alkalicoccus daliensis]|uniref:Lipoprotein n=1 Tax=Alkalicoccus daliensis TaxID=745820 RepID=A0A1H0D004_9BACI|nr:hypothetical protein [Alkalicoccus daliensis]SDN63497.1 hypothetical protein SAMN04488053_102294 [Alkalicoccus daliensis]